jgi:hypothetical protein
MLAKTGSRERQMAIGRLAAKKMPRKSQDENTGALAIVPGQ